MDYRPLGRTGIQVSSLCLGAAMFGKWGNTDHADCAKIILRAHDRGINFVDTADVYSNGESEVIVGEALSQLRREEIVLGTKVHGSMGEDPNAGGNSRRWIIAECEHSLRRLGVDHIDLYQVHRPDPTVDIEETLGALTDLQTAGKIRAFGSSTFPAYQVVEAQAVAERRNLGRFSTEQPPYSILTRAIEADVLPVAERYGLGVLTWGPLAGGWLSGRFGQGKPNTSHRATGNFPGRYDLTQPQNQRKLEVATRLGALADEAGVTLVELAVAFVLTHPAVSSAIIGPRTMEQLDSQLRAPEVTIGDEVLDAIDQLVAPGTDIAPWEVSYAPPALTDADLRRRAGTRRRRSRRAEPT